MIFSKGKYEEPARRVRKRSALLLLSLVLILAMSVGGTVAFLVTNTEGLTNTFKPGKISTEIEEELEGEVKKNVKVENTSKIDAYVRATIVVNWVKGTGTNQQVFPAVVGEDYILTIGDGWSKDGGHYDYNGVVKAETATGVLITECRPLKETGPEGSHLEVTILSQAIQAVGQDANGNKPVSAWTGCELAKTN